MTASLDRLRRHFGDLVPEAQKLWEHTKFTQRYNIAPSQAGLVIRRGKAGYQAINLRWQFRPNWLEDRMPGWINAKAETVFQKAAFRKAASETRCLVPATGWYEWKGAKAPKQPYHLHFGHDRVSAFAGIWARRRSEKGWEESFAILTTEAAGIAGDIHHRMPLVLHPRFYADWLGPTLRKPEEMMVQFDNGELTAYPVSSYVNKPENEGAECLQPVSARIMGNSACGSS